MNIDYTNMRYVSVSDTIYLRTCERLCAFQQFQAALCSLRIANNYT